MSHPFARLARSMCVGMSNWKKQLSCCNEENGLDGEIDSKIQEPQRQ